MDSLHGAPYSGVNGFINNKQHRFSRTDAASVFKRVAERRGYEISTLTMTSVHAILEEISDLTGEIISASTVQNSGKMVEALLLKQYEIICDPESPSGKKRRAHDISSEIFRLIDVHVNDKESTESTETMRKKRRLSANRVAMQAGTEASFYSSSSSADKRAAASLASANITNSSTGGQTSFLVPTHTVQDVEKTSAASRRTSESRGIPNNHGAIMHASTNRTSCSSMQQQSGVTTSQDAVSYSVTGIGTSHGGKNMPSSDPTSNATTEQRQKHGDQPTPLTPPYAMPNYPIRISTNDSRRESIVGTSNKSKPRSTSSTPSATNVSIAHESVTPTTVQSSMALASSTNEHFASANNVSIAHESVTPTRVQSSMPLTNNSSEHSAGTANKSKLRSISNAAATTAAIVHENLTPGSMARASTTNENSSLAKKNPGSVNKSQPQSIVPLSAPSATTTALANESTTREGQSSMDRTRTSSVHSAQAGNITGIVNKSNPRSAANVSAASGTAAAIAHESVTPIRVPSSMARASSTNEQSSQKEIIAGLINKIKPRSTASTNAIVHESPTRGVQSSLASASTINEHFAQAEINSGTVNKSRSRSLASLSSASASTANIAYESNTPRGQSSTARAGTTNSYSALENVAGAVNKSRPRSIASTTAAATAHKRTTVEVPATIARASSTNKHSALEERITGIANKSKTRAISSLSATSAPAFAMVRDNTTPGTQSSLAWASTTYERSVQAESDAVASNKSKPRSIASLSAAAATTAAIAHESSSLGDESCLSRVNNTNEHSAHSATSNRNKPRSTASLSVASATTAAIAHESSTLGDRSSVPPANNINEQSAQVSNHLTAPPPVYEKRSSNAIAHRELHLQQERKSKKVPDPSQTKNTTMVNGIRPQSVPSSTNGTDHERTSLITTNDGRQINQMSSQQKKAASMSSTNTSSSGATPSGTSSSTSGAKSATRTDSAALSLLQKPNSAALSVKAKDEVVQSLERKRANGPTIAESPFTVTIPLTSGSPMDMDISDDEDNESPDYRTTTADFSVTIIFPADIGKPNIACYVDPRPAVAVQFTNEFPSGDSLHNVAARFSRWEPFWVVEKELFGGVTAPIKRKNHVVERGDSRLCTPNTAGSFTVKHLWQSVSSYLQQNSKPIDDKPKDGEYRVLIRMLPLKLSDYQKGKRADCHLWPLGTYLQVYRDGERQKYPQLVVQRKQQAHDKSKWLYLCYPHDFSPFIQNHCRTTDMVNFELCCHDQEQYIFSLDLCRYRSPQSLSRDVKKDLKRLSLEASFRKAKEMMKNNEVSLDSDDENSMEGGNKLSRTLFSLQDPISRIAIGTPVRGKNCRHFSVSAVIFPWINTVLHGAYSLLGLMGTLVQCFDLDIFLQVHEGVSGQRWKCARCEKFLSYKDLEFCALTEYALASFKDEMTAEQYMVEVREDRSMELMKPTRTRAERQKTRQTRTKKKQENDEGNNIAKRKELEIIEID
jgi:hypothetical protein